MWKRMAITFNVVPRLIHSVRKPLPCRLFCRDGYVWQARP